MPWSQSSEAVTTGEVTAAITASALLKASNLSDLADPVAARYNLGMNAFGNVLVVDAVYGDDLLASSGGYPYATVEAAIADAVDGETIFLFPGHHALSAGITIPTGVAVRGLSHGNCAIEKLLATADTTLITMSNRVTIENVTLRLTSAEHHTLIGILFPGTTAEDAQIERSLIEVDNSTAGDVGTSNVYGVRSTGTGIPVTFDSLVTTTIHLHSAGSGAKRGVLVDTAVHTFSMATVYIHCSRTGAGAGSYIGLEVNFPGATVLHRFGKITGTPTADISQTSGTLILGTPLLEDATANGLGFSTVREIPSFGWGDNGATSSGTRFLYIGTATASTSEPGIRLHDKTVMLNLSVRAVTGPGGARTDTWTLRKNGVDTALTVSLTGAQVTSENTSVSVTFAAGDVVSLKQVCAASSTTADVQVRCSYV